MLSFPFNREDGILSVIGRALETPLKALYFAFPFVFFLFVIQPKAFWLDEWFTLVSIKLKDASTYWSGSLEYAQEFPRVYLSLIKVFSDFFNYSEASIRFFPFLFGTLSLLLWYRISKNLFLKWGRLYFFLALFFFLGCDVTYSYFNQVKQYTADIFAAFVVWYQMSVLGKAFEGEWPSVSTALVILLSTVILPFFSFTYAFAVAPLVGILLLRKIFLQKKFAIDFSMLFVLSVFIGLLLSYWFEIRLVMGDGQMKIYWKEFLANYTSWNDFWGHAYRSWFNFFTLMYSTPSSFTFFGLAKLLEIFRWGIGILTFSGYLIAGFWFFRGMNGRGKSLFSFESYSFLLLLATVVAYLLDMIPIGGSLGPNRLNYFALPFHIYCFLSAFRLLVESTNGLVKQGGLAFGILLLGYVAGKSGAVLTREILGQSAWYPNSSYRLAGQSIREAQSLNVPLYIAKEAVNYHHEIYLKTHPAYDLRKNIAVKKAASETDACQMLLGDHRKQNGVLLLRSQYKTLTTQDCLAQLKQKAQL